MPITGECFCGAIAYSVSGELSDARSCHCSRCRKAFSAQASAYALVNPSDFEWQTGEELLTVYESESGAGLAFCSQCGSTLCGMADGKVHGVTLGCINENPPVTISRHIHVGSKASWEKLPEGVVVFENGVGDL